MDKRSEPRRRRTWGPYYTYLANPITACPKNKDCQLKHIDTAENGNFICVGVRKHPKMYKHDKIGMCLSGKFSKIDIEMTRSEAMDIICNLGRALM